LEFFGSAVVAGLIALGGLILTIYTQKPGVVVPWALCVHIEIGNGAGDTGNRTTIFAVLLPTPFMNWLVKTVNIAGGIPSPDLPAEAHIADEAVVTRNSDTKPCSF